MAGWTTHCKELKRSGTFRRAIAGAAFALSIAGCAATPPEPAPETGDRSARYAPGARQALLAWLNNEWRRFGKGRSGHVVDLRRVGPADPPRWPQGLSPEQRLCGHIRTVYWTAVGSPERSELAPVASRRPDDTPICDNAWSAAFVSGALHVAGVQARDFRFDAQHSIYLKDILRRYRAWQMAPDRHPMPLFVPHPLETRIPQAGDLICATRRRESEAVLRVLFLPDGPGAAAAWDAAMGGMEFGHCDFVVAVDSRRRLLRAIGGNVQDTVAMSLIPLDGRGHLIRTIERPWFIVVENRLP
ncbi:MAG TPA: DUF2272 domain-containing protein [Vineibacter sp.]|nr:DUF2272 domain-containing protein [Vineibacter sp.]